MSTLIFTNRKRFDNYYRITIDDEKLYLLKKKKKGIFFILNIKRTLTYDVVFVRVHNSRRNSHCSRFLRQRGDAPCAAINILFDSKKIYNWIDNNILCRLRYCHRFYVTGYR